MDNRGTSAVVGKLLAAGIVLLYVSGTTAVLLGDVVPGARRSTGQELAERVVGDASARLERALEPVDGRLEGKISLEVPETIAGAAYTLRLRDGRLELRHPNPAIEARAGLELPPAVTDVTTTIESGSNGRLVVAGPAGNRTIRLVEVGP